MGLLDSILKGAQGGAAMRAEAEQRFPEYAANIAMPEDASDVGLMALGGPFGKIGKLGGLALAAGAYAPEAEAGWLSKIRSLLGKKAPRALPEGYSFKEFGHSPEDREAINQLIAPLRAVGSPVDLDDRDIFTAMMNTYKVNPEAKTRFLMDELGNPKGAYQIYNRGAESYLPNLAVAEQKKGYGRALMEHAISNRENPSFLVSAPGKEDFYRKFGMKEKQDDGISSFHFKHGGLVQYVKGLK